MKAIDAKNAIHDLFALFACQNFGEAITRQFSINKVFLRFITPTKKVVQVQLLYVESAIAVIRQGTRSFVAFDHFITFEQLFASVIFRVIDFA